jgi:hypothetical protein
MDAAQLAADVLTAARTPFAPLDSSGGTSTTQTLYADDPAPTLAPLDPAPPDDETTTIQNIKAPWVYLKWPTRLPTPPGYTRDYPDPPSETQAIRGYVVGNALLFGPPSSAEAVALIRQSAAAAFREATRGLREEMAKGKRDYYAGIYGDRIGPGPRTPRPSRPSRASRPPRAPRPPRFPRRPRRPRANGTKGQNDKPKPCKRRNSLGICQRERCIPDAEIPEPNVGHSSCNWGPVDSCGNCVQLGCNGPFADLLKPFLKYLPKYWSVESVQKKQVERRIQQQERKRTYRFATLPARTTNPEYVPPPSTIGGPSGGCACQAWPGWVICDTCIDYSGLGFCTCPGTCVRLTVNIGAC